MQFHVNTDFHNGCIVLCHFRRPAYASIVLCHCVLSLSVGHTFTVFGTNVASYHDPPSFSIVVAQCHILPLLPIVLAGYRSLASLRTCALG